MPLPESPEVSEKQVPLRETLAAEMREHMAFREAAEDSHAYRFASAALKKFAERGLSSAASAERELNTQKTLPNDDPKKMSPEEIRKYERMMTEVETWTLTIPSLLQNIRVVQYSPEVEQQLWNMFTLVHDREEFLRNLGNMRFRALKGSDKNPFSPFEHAVPEEFFELAAIMTTQWMLRENLRTHPELLQPNHRGDLQEYLHVIQTLVDWEAEGEWLVPEGGPTTVDAFIIAQTKSQFVRPDGVEALQTLFRQGRVTIVRQGESEGKPAKPTDRIRAGDTVKLKTVFKRTTDRVGAGMEEARATAETQRRSLNAERVTQNLPGAVEFAFNVSSQADVWKRLLTELGGPNDRKRYAGQLLEDVSAFRSNFLEKKALEEFRDDAKRMLEEAKTDNAKAKNILKFFFWVTGKTLNEEITDRLTTKPEELQRVYDEVMAKVEEGFDAVASPEHDATIKELTQLLENMRNGKDVDQRRLKELLTQYGDVIFETGRVMSVIQAWQVGENVQRVGGEKPANNIDLVTRVDNKSLSQWLSSFSPYGALKTRSMIDKDGRIILLTDDDSFTEQGWAHVREMGKMAAEHAALSVVLSHLLSKLHLLFLLAPGVHGIVRLLGNKFAGPLTAVAQAELAMIQAKEIARFERIKKECAIVDECIATLLALKKNPKLRTPEQKEAPARALGAKLRASLSTLFHAARGQGDLPQIASGQRDTDIRPDLFLEAHVYANQILMATGFPPVAELDASGPGAFPGSPDTLEKTIRDGGTYEPNISPELRTYLDAKVRDDERQNNARENARLNGMRDAITASTHARLDALRDQVNAPKKSKNERFLAGEEYPSSSTVSIQVADMTSVMKSREMQLRYPALSDTAEKRTALLQYAAEVILFNHEMKMTHQGNVRYKGKPGYGLIGWIPGPHQYIPEEYKGDQRHIIPRSTLDDWNARAQTLVRVPMERVLAAALYLDGTTLEEEDFARLSGIDVAKLQNLAGGRMRSEFLSRWADLRQYADKYAPPPEVFHEQDYWKWDEKINGYVTIYVVDGATVHVQMQPLASSTTYRSGTLTQPNKDAGFRIRILDAGNVDDWGGNDTWRVWGAGFYDNKDEPQEVRNRFLDLLTLPAYDNREWASIDRVLSLFPQDKEAHSGLHSALAPMYKESFRKHTFLQELFRSIRKNGGKADADNWETILKEMRQMQEYGLFGYSPVFDRGQR